MFSRSFGCYAVMGENIRGSQGRRGGGKMEERGGVGGMREEGRKDGEGGMGDAGDGGRVSEWWWVMKYSVRVCLWLLPSFFFFRHLWLTVLFIGVPVVQGTHLQSFFLCTLSELREGDKE